MQGTFWTWATDFLRINKSRREVPASYVFHIFSSSTTTTQWQTAAHGSSGKSAPINQTLWILFISTTLYTLLPEKVSNIQCCSEYPSSKIWQILGFWESRLDDHWTGKRDICQDSPPINDDMATLYLPEIYSLHWSLWVGSSFIFWSTDCRQTSSSRRTPAWDFRSFVTQPLPIMKHCKHIYCLSIMYTTLSS